jgi:hypothetical protein
MTSNANTHTVELSDGRQVCFSYGVPVAAFVPGRGYIQTDNRYSVTTSKHANAFAGKNAPRIAPAEFAVLIAPLSVRDR